MLKYYAKPINRDKMPRLIGKQVAEFLVKHGWKYSYTNGSHYMYVKSGFDDIPIPIHNKKVLGKGLIEQIIEDSGIDKEKWMNFRY